jgi:dolichol-phosphate mannosyltransferase
MKKEIEGTISIIIPCFNEESNLSEIYSRLLLTLNSNSIRYEIIFINDGSQDDTSLILERLSKQDKHTHFITFSRNFGHQAALKAGLDFCTGEAAISMDADLQHPPEMIPKFVEKWRDGYDIVYTQRQPSKDTSFLKRILSLYFYKLMNSLSDISFDNGIADFRLLDRKVIDMIKNTPESNLFLRGYISWIGFKTFKIIYQPNKRFTGTTKYSYRKMMSLAVNGITSFSIKPLRISILLGIAISTLTFFYSIYAIIMYMFNDKTISGWTSVILSILFIGGIQLLMLGIIGQYLGNLFMQAKHRPDYIIQDKSI